MDLLKQHSTKIISRVSKIIENEKQLLFFIFAFGLALRLLGLINITLAGDNLTHWKIVGEIVTKGIYPLLGPRASLTGNFNLGPFYYYLLAIPYWIGGGNFRMAIIFFALINSLSIPLLYLVAKRWFTKLQAFGIIMLYACSFYFIQIQSFPWNPYVLPLFIILSLYFTNKIHAKKYHYFILLTVSYGICLQLHATSLFLLPVFIYLLPLKKIPLKYYLAGIAALLLVNFPWIWVNFTGNFGQIRAGLLILTPGKATACSLTNWLTNHGHGEKCFWYFRNTLLAFRFITISLFGVNNVLLALLSIIITVFYFAKTKLTENRFLFFWVFIPVFLFLFYSNSIYLHYLLILTPVPFFLMVVVLEKIKSRGKRWNYIVILLYLFIVLINLGQYIWSLQFVRG